MRRNSLGVCLLAFAALSAPATAATRHVAPHYAVIRQISGSGTDWDYESVDAGARRLYIAHHGVAALDLTTNKFTPRLLAGKMTHGVLPLGAGTVVADDGVAHTVTFFQGATGKVLAVLSIPHLSGKKGIHDPDALAFDARTGLLVAANGDSSDLVLINVKKRAIEGSIPVGGDLEFAVSDGAGKLFVNVASTNEIAEVDLVARKVISRFPLKECDGPSGLSFDPSDHLLISVCFNGVVKFIDAGSGRDLKTLKVGAGPDSVVFDADRHLAFVPSGLAGTLSVISVHSATDITVAQTVPTGLGARIGALDPKTGRVYLPIARFGPPTADYPYPKAIEGTFEILVVAPNRSLAPSRVRKR